MFAEEIWKGSGLFVKLYSLDWDMLNIIFNVLITDRYNSGKRFLDLS